jgi:Chalcone isomerase-like
MKKYLIVLLTMLALSHAGVALEIQGVTVAPQVQVAGNSLQLNGAGLRTFNLLMVPIRIYVAAFYTPAALRTAEAVMASSGPMQFDFTFLRAVGQSDVTKAWSSQFAQSVNYTYPGYERDRDAFIAMFGPLSSGGVEQVRFVGTNTVVFDQGAKKGIIPGRDFQKAFLSLWFGKNPVAPDLKASLLGR